MAEAVRPVAVAALAGGGTAIPVAPSPPFGTAKVQSPDGVLNVRSGPKGSAKKLRELKDGDVVDVFELGGAWCRIARDAEEWVARQYVLPETAPSDHSVVITLPTPSVDHHLTQIDVLYEVFYSKEARKTLRRDVPLFSTYRSHGSLPPRQYADRRGWLAARVFPK